MTWVLVSAALGGLWWAARLYQRVIRMAETGGAEAMRYVAAFLAMPDPEGFFVDDPLLT